MVLTQEAKDWILEDFRNYLKDSCYIEDYEELLEENSDLLVDALTVSIENYFYELDSEDFPSDEERKILAKEMIDNGEIFPTYEILEVLEKEYPNIYNAIRELSY